MSIDGLHGKPNSTRLILYRNHYNEKGLLCWTEGIVEVVQCRDCKFFVSDMEWCEADDEHPASPDAFCSWAERRDG